MDNNHIYTRQGGSGEMRCCLCGVGPWVLDPEVGCEVKIRRHKSKGMSNSDPIQIKYLIPTMLSRGYTK